jgi:TonB family protein
MRKSLKIGFVLLLLGLVWSTDALAQTKTDQERAAEQALKALRAREIPEATLPTTPDEANWWKEIRAAGNAIRSKSAISRKDDFARLVKQGGEKSYRVPTLDRHATVLWKDPPNYTEEARRKRITGSVALTVELRPDGTVGEIKIVQSLEPGLDQMAVNSARKLVFLPAVKDRKFVSFWMPMTMSFNVY